MVKLSIVLASVASIYFASTPVLAQDFGSCSNNCTVFATVAACGDSDLTCLCAPAVLTGINSCISCATAAGLDLGSDVTSGATQVQTLCASVANATTSVTGAASSATGSAKPTSSASAPASTATTAPPSNGATTVQLTFGLAAAAAALALGTL